MNCMIHTRRLFLMALSACFLVSSPAWSQDATLSTHETAARDFKFERTTPLGATYEEVKKRYPGMFYLKEQSNPELKVKCYGVSRLIDTKVTACSTTAFFFHEEKIYMTGMVYDVDDLTRIGSTAQNGLDVLHKKVIEKFGSDYKYVDGDQLEEFTWKFPKVKREVWFKVSIKDQQVYLRVTDTGAQEEIQKKAEAAADTGF